MNRIGKNIFRAIHEGKWLQIEYQNKTEQTTKYWIGIIDMNVKNMSLAVDALHKVSGSLAKYKKIYIKSILSAEVIEGSYQEKNKLLIQDIKFQKERYEGVFGNIANLKILNYLSECSRLDTTPYYCEYSLLSQFDGGCLEETTEFGGIYHLQPEQFQSLIKEFTKETEHKHTLKSIELAMNVLSVHIPKEKGLYVLAYRRLLFDIKNKVLRTDETVTICYEYQILEQKQSIRQFLDAEEYELLDDFEQNVELIKDKITINNKQICGVDDMPYIIAIGRDIKIDLKQEYEAIVDMYEQGFSAVTDPIKAFFGEFVSKPTRRKEYPFALLDKRINLDQLLAVHNAMKYPLTYIQGPPGTGKTSTIINTITTAFFNDQTVLLTSYNNHPIDSVLEKMCNIHCKYGRIPFPVIRLGNNKMIMKALEYMRTIYEETKNIKILEENLSNNKRRETQKLTELSALLKRYEESIELQEKKDSISKLADTQQRHLLFYADLHDRQLRKVSERQQELGTLTIEKALKLLPQNEQYLLQYFYFASAKCIKRLDEPKNSALKSIILSEGNKKISEFNKYLSEEKNVEQFLRIFPIVLTTCISAHKIGTPKQYFDITIVDEASQCNTAVSLVPLIRGKSLMLVGDPQQLNPVITLNPKTNEALKKIYYVTPEYDYIKNSIFKTYLACDAVSYEILLSHHYRCHKKIIEFNNHKYYHGKLKIDSKVKSAEPLIYMNVPNTTTQLRNTSPEEAEVIIKYAANNQEKNIGIITPFANQRECIKEMLDELGIKNITYGTVHAFQGDEKDIIIFSMAVTAQTGEKTYSWLKNNKELINVATSRAKEQLIVVADELNLKRLHDLHAEDNDDLYELVQYVKTNGKTAITPRNTSSRALGIKPYSTKTENAFLENLNHVLENIMNENRKCSIKKEVPIKQVFGDAFSAVDLFYTGQFDFVVYQKDYAKNEMPLLAIELDGKEHLEDEVVRERDRKKNHICKEHHLELIRIDNTYARRYYYMKDILIDYFRKIYGR